ncbi:hypothetical protein LRS73_18045 [Methylobacterium currus]|uniref:DEAD/DEAH box helicase n=1 Tax=Methylobacterium currus TaxID=2051553 RepID=UPI001E2B606B|nr:helicase-related protein [Methylobacterium currus]UHC14450.1 hypothetical protein LRS73_18045 [Methylobacterium currus]
MLGVTATPERSDGRGLAEIFDEMVIGPSVADLIALKHLVRPIVYAPSTRSALSSVETRMGDYDRAQLAEVMSSAALVGDVVAHYRRLAAGLPAVAFYMNRAHSELVAERFRAAAISAAHVDGNTPRDDRRAMLAALGTGGLQVLTNCGLVSEGVDVPVIGAAILLWPTKSLALYLQLVGRALRPSPGKDRSVILDHAGNSLGHGLPEAARDWSLEAKPRRAHTAVPEAAGRLRRCPACDGPGRTRNARVRGLWRISAPIAGGDPRGGGGAPGSIPARDRRPAAGDDLRRRLPMGEHARAAGRTRPGEGLPPRVGEAPAAGDGRGGCAWAVMRISTSGPRL